MFKTILFAIALTASTLASAATLDREVPDSSGMKKICIYTDGTTITMGAMSMCPLSK